MQTMKRILAALLLAACLMSVTVGLTACRGEDDAFGDDFWLLTEDMRDYIDTLSRDLYTKTPLTIDDIEEPTMEDVEKYIESAIFSTLKETDYTNMKTGKVQAGDTVSLWYRGEVNIAKEGEEANWVEFIGGSNMTGTAQSLRIGSGSFIDGFEDSLIGVDIATTDRTTQPGRGYVIGSYGLPIVDVIYQYSYVDGETGKAGPSSTMTDRIDLRKDEHGNFTGSKRYEGTTLREDLFGKSPASYISGPYVASFDITGDLVDDEVTITNVAVVSIVTREDVAEFTIKFPDDYSSKALAGLESRWSVVIESINRPPENMKTTETVDYDFVKTTMQLTYQHIILVMSAEEIAAVGDNEDKQKAAVMEHYKDYILYALRQQRASTAAEAVQTAFWSYVVDNFEPQSYPEELLEAYTESLLQQAQAEYDQYQQGANNVSFPTLGAYLANFYDEKYFPDDNSVEAGIAQIAKEQLRQEMVLYYIAQVEDLALTASERAKLAEEGIAQALAYYNTQMKDQLNGSTLVEADLAQIGVTRRSIVENRYLELVNSFLADELMQYAKFENGESVADSLNFD